MFKIDLHTHTIHVGDCPDPNTQTNPHTDTTINNGSDTTNTTDGSNNTNDPNTDVPTH